MTIPREALLTILQAALSEPIGLIIRTSDSARARAALYKARTDAHDPRLSVLQIRMSPFPDGDLVICHPTPTSRHHGLAPDIGDIPD